MEKKYRKTFLACYLGFITQAIAATFLPLLYLKLHADFSISIGKIALISTTFYFTQLIIDVICAKFVDRIGYRKAIVTSEIASALGLIGMAILPDLMPDPFLGIMICVIVYAVGSGLIEVLCSPIVEACPSENKETAMSLLHSFYCWGCVAVIVISTLFFHFAGIDHWRWMAVIWAIIPLYNVYNFMTCPIENIVEDGKGMSIGHLFQTPMFWVSIVLMICAGASEISMSQWASAYAESAIGLSKSVGDLAGPCMFAVMEGISRVFYGKYGEKMDLMKFMMASGGLCLICYLMASVSASPMAGLIGCMVCGFSVGIMWPGTISISTKRMPTGGTAMFAFLAMAGDMGGSIGPSIVGFITQGADDNLRQGMLYAAVFPLILILSLVVLSKMKKKEQA